MIRLLKSIVFIMFLASPAWAVNDIFLVEEPTDPMALGEVLDEPVCFNVINRAPYTVFGSINTNYFIRADGIKTRHRSNFRLDTEESAEFCTSGPFYDEQRVELVLRTLIPTFNCKTQISEDIVIYGRKKKEGGTDTYAVCS